MGKNTEIKFFGQPIFKQILGLLDIVDLKAIVKRNESDKYYKTYASRTQLVTMLFGILSRCDSMGEICDGMRAMSGKLNHLGLTQSPAKSTACHDYGMSISPNPSKGLIHLSMDWSKNATGLVSIYNTMGKLVYQEKMNEPTKTIQIKQPSGVYLLKATCGDNSPVTSKFIIEK